MKEQLSALYELQGFDVRIAGINAALGKLDGARLLKARLASVEKTLHETQSALHEVESELKDNELKLKSIDEKRGSYEKRLYGKGSQNTRELSAMEREVELLKAQQDQLDGRVLELYDQVEAARGRVSDARKRFEELQSQIDRALAEEAEERKRLEAELADVRRERDEAASKVTDRALMSRYESLVARTGATGVAKVVGGRCEGCRVSVTSFTLRKLFEDRDIERCENCGRILLMDPE